MDPRVKPAGDVGVWLSRGASCRQLAARTLVLTLRTDTAGTAALTAEKIMPVDRRRALPLLGASLLLAGIPCAQAQAYPGRPVRIIVPYPPGGPYDGIPRLIA